MNKEVLNIMKITKYASENFDRIICAEAKKLGISKCEADVLLFFYENPEFNNAKDAVFKNHVSKAYVSKAISLLLKKNLINIYIDELDKRYQKIKINDKAIPIINSLINTQQKAIDYFIRDIEKEDFKIFLKVINSIENKIIKLEERK